MSGEVECKRYVGIYVGLVSDEVRYWFEHTCHKKMKIYKIFFKVKVVDRIDRESEMGFEIEATRKKHRIIKES